MKQGVVLFPVELSPTSSHDAHREFQPLGFVDTHNAHHVFPLGAVGSGSQVGLLLFQPVDKPDKPGKAVVTGTLIPLGISVQKPQVSKPAFSAGEGLHQVPVARFFIEKV